MLSRPYSSSLYRCRTLSRRSKQRVQNLFGCFLEGALRRFAGYHVHYFLVGLDFEDAVAAQYDIVNSCERSLHDIGLATYQLVLRLQGCVRLVLQVTYSSRQVEIAVDPPFYYLSPRLFDTCHLFLIIRLMVFAQSFRLASYRCHASAVTSVGDINLRFGNQANNRGAP